MAFGMPGLAQDAAEGSLGPGAPWPLCWMFCPTSSQPDRVYQYSVKVVQGRTSDVEILGPGQYTTSVNIHNPWCHSVKYQVKLALAGRNSVEGAITLYSSFTLGPDGVTEFDSVGFKTLLNATLPAFFEGYFVIQCEEELDVVAVYAGTVEEQTPHGLSTIETERVPARMVPRGRDLSANISTGVAPWVISSVPLVGSTLTAGLLAPISNPKCGAWVDPVAANVQWGAVWVGESNCTWTGKGVYTYDYTFDLCCGFHDARICFRLWADNNATVFLNDMSTPVTTVTGNFGATAVAPIYITSGFLVGPNLLRIEVENMNPNPGLPAQTSGMMLDGRMCVEAGICP
jgi:hypothetical protein